MPTKKKPDPPAAEKPKGERGRYARMLAEGYVVEVESAKPPHTKAAELATRRATPTE
jgi:hypothetical protein